MGICQAQLPLAAQPLQPRPLVTVLGARKRSEGHRWSVLQALQIYDAEDPICAMRAALSIDVFAVPRLDVQDDACSPLHIQRGWRRAFQWCALTLWCTLRGQKCRRSFGGASVV